MAEQNLNQASPQANPDKKDVTKSTIIILVILTLVISIIGTWTVLNEVNNIPKQESQQTSSTVGTVELTITGPPKPSSTTGRVTLDIKKPK